MPTPVTPADFSQIRWRGHWIWVLEEPVKPSGFMLAGINPQAKEAHALFRKTLRFDHVPDRAPARITADSRYALFVNGQPAARGPIRSQRRRLHYDMVDLAPYLQPGENVLAIYVTYYRAATSLFDRRESRPRRSIAPRHADRAKEKRGAGDTGSDQ